MILADKPYFSYSAGTAGPNGTLFTRLRARIRCAASACDGCCKF